MTVDATILQGRTKCAIVGFCSPHREWAPYLDPEFSIVGLNRGYIFMPRADVWFDMHSPEIRAWAHRRPGKHSDFLRAFPGPIYLHEADPELPHSVTYPLQAVAEDLGEHVFRLFEDATVKDTRDEPYLDSSIAYELALAIHEGVKEIWLLGVDLNTQGEYVWQRSGVHYLLGVAAGRGIKVVIPEPCPLLRGTLYGRGFKKPEGERLTAPQMETRLHAVEQERDALNIEYHRMLGRQRELNFLVEQIVPGIDHLELVAAQSRMPGELQSITARLAETTAAAQEVLEVHRQAAIRDQAALLTESAEVEGASQLLGKVAQIAGPGLHRERIEERKKHLDALCAELFAKTYQAQGRFKEMIYLIHQTADGQPARQAIAQLTEGEPGVEGDLDPQWATWTPSPATPASERAPEYEYELAAIP